MKQLIAAIFLIMTVVFGNSPLSANQHEDSMAMKGEETAKAIFDINFGEPEKLLLYLSVIEETYKSLRQQGYHPDFIIAFRGSSVRLITTETRPFDKENQLRLQKGANLLRKLSEQGVRFEACTVATNLFKIDNDSLLSEVKPVDNTFVSLIGYQAKGYSLIPIQ